MNKTFRKVLSVVLALVMVVTSMTISNTTVKADGVIVFGTPTDNGNGTFTVAVTAEGAAYIEYYLQDADGGLHNAESANGWVWNTNPDYQPYMTADNVIGSDDGVINVAAGGTFTLVCNAYSSAAVVDETTLLDTASIDIEVAEYVVENTDLNLTVDDISKGNMTGDGPRFNWEAVTGAASYKFQALKADGTEVRSWNINGSTFTLYYWGSDVKAESVGAATYTAKLTALDAGGNVVAEDTIENVPAYNPVNTDAGLTATVTSTEASLAWTAITNAASYAVYANDELVATVTGTTYIMAIDSTTTYAVEVKALDADGAEIAITNNTAEVKYVAEAAPSDHDITKVDTSSWVNLAVKKGTVDNSYAINGSHTLSTGVWYGIFAPHSTADYHGERDKCVLGDAASFTFQQSDVKEIWVNGNKYGNPSTAFNNQGDCSEISLNVLTEEINLVTLVLTNGTMNTFAIKMTAPLGPDATAEATQATIDPESVTDWVQMAGISENGSTAFISSAVEMGNAGLRGYYAANGSPNWNISDKMKTVPVFGFVTAGGNASSVIIDGTEYVNAMDARNELVYIGNDCVYINQSLINAGTGETKYITITATGTDTGTFLVKVVGPEQAQPEGEPDQTLDEVTDWVKVDGGNDVAAAAKSTYGTVYYISQAFRDAYIPYLDICGLYDTHDAVNYHPAGCTLTGPTFAFALVGGYEGEVKLPAGTLKSVWVDGVMYESGTELCYLDGDQIHLAQSIFEDVKTYAVTVRTSVKDYTFAVKVDNVATYNITVDGEVVATVDEGATYTLGDATNGYLYGDVAYKAGTEVTVNSDMEFTSIGDVAITAAQGAGIRYAETSGIRFMATVDASEDVLNSAAVTTGMLITANDIYVAHGSELSLDMLTDADGNGLYENYAALNVVNDGWFGTVGTYCGSIIEIDEANYIREFIAVAYATITYSDGTTVTVHSNMTGARSIKGVAQAVKDAGYAEVDAEYYSVIDAYAAAR